MSAQESKQGAPGKPASEKAPTDGRWSRAHSTQHVTDFAKEKPARGPQVGAWVLWVVGLALEVFAITEVTGSLDPYVTLTLWQRVLICVGALLVDLVLVLLATRLWRAHTQQRAKARGKKAAGPSRIGVVMACVSFVPMVLFFATSKNADRRTLLVSIVSALVAAAGLGALAVVL